MSGWHCHMLVRRVAIVATIVGSLLAITSPAADAKRDTRPVLAIGNSYDGTVNFIDARRLRRWASSQCHPGWPNSSGSQAGSPFTTSSSLLARGIQLRARGGFSPNGKILYVSRGYLGDIAALASPGGRCCGVSSCRSFGPIILTVSPDGSTIFATSLPGTKVYAISAATHQIVGSYEAGTYPHVLEFSPNRHYLYSGSLGNQLAPSGQDNGVHELAVADPRTLQVVTTYPFAAGVQPFAFSENGSRAWYCRLSYFNGFEVLNLQSFGQVARTVDLPLPGPGLALAPADCRNAAAVAGLTSAARPYAIQTISNYVSARSPAHRQSAEVIHVGQAPGRTFDQSRWS